MIAQRRGCGMFLALKTCLSTAPTRCMLLLVYSPATTLGRTVLLDCEAASLLWFISPHLYLCILGKVNYLYRWFTLPTLIVNSWQYCIPLQHFLLFLTFLFVHFILVIGESRISRLSGEVHTVSVASDIHGPRRALWPPLYAGCSMKVDSFWRCTGSAGVYPSVESGKATARRKSIFRPAV